MSNFMKRYIMLNLIRIKFRLRKSDSFIVYFDIKNELYTLGISNEMGVHNRFRVSNVEYGYLKLKYPEHVFLADDNSDETKFL